MVYHVFIKCDFPVKNAVVEFEDKKTTLADLKTLFGKACEVEEKKLDGYTLLAVSFGSLPRELITPTMDESARAKVMKQTLTELEVKDQSTIIAVAPVGSGKPTYKLSEKKEKSKDEEGETKDKPKKVKGSDDDIDEKHFKGMTAKNILGKFTEEKDKKKKKYATQYLEIHAKDVFKAKEWLSADKKVVAEVLALNGLNCTELEVYKALCAWAKANNKEKKDLNTFLGDLIELIRFPTMQAGDIASVAGDAVLTQDQILALFSYVGTKSKTSKLDKCIDKFSTKPRDPLDIDNVKWTRSSAGNTISKDGKTVTFANCYVNVMATAPRKNSKGQYIYTIRIEGGEHHMIGWAAPTVNIESYSSSYFFSNGYFMYSYDGSLYSSGSSGRSVGAQALHGGDVLTCVYDSNEHTAWYIVNGREIKSCFTGVYGDLVPAITNGGANTSGSIALIKTPKI
eukprot:TRINITY_DN722_c0_g1_i1.p1 TRINITY_DN722_c0_g1~~TRINITY_DN722_c0_g1_i1.p1  ORF type:complete len:454 (-),score=126.60 TRINITY_DN722_c0_g1_i1:722-2083(-)